MINWMYFPKNKYPDEISIKVVKAFESVSEVIDSYSNKLKSDEVLASVRPKLEKIGFSVEKSKKTDDIIAVPVLYGLNGKVEKSFEADGYLASFGYVIEVEAGRGVTNNQFLKDFFEACTMVGVDKLCICVRNIYGQNYDFNNVCKFFDSLYTSNRLVIPLSGLLIIGY